MSKHRKWLNLATKIAVKHNFPKYQMAAVVVRGGRVMAIGVNRFGPGVLKHKAYANKCIHAELDAVMQLNPAVLRNSTIYIAGVSKGNNTIKSRPCPACQQILKEMGIKAAVWHEKNSDIVQEKYREV